MTAQSALHILSSFWIVFALILAAVCYRLILRLFGVVLIPQNSIGIVDKRYSLVGRNRTLPEGQIVIPHLPEKRYLRWMETKQTHLQKAIDITSCT